MFFFFLSTKKTQMKKIQVENYIGFTCDSQILRLAGLLIFISIL